MNPDTKTTEYIAQLKDLKLSDSARARIKDNLQEYAAFHGVRVGNEARSIPVVPQRTSLFSLKFAYMPLVILLVIMIGGGTTLAAQNSLPGDTLYPVKIGINENVREALAVSVDSEAKLQANLLEERLEEAQKLLTKGRLTAETESTVVVNISAQAKRAEAAAENSSEDVRLETKAKIALALENFLTTTNLDTKLAAEISNSNSDATTMATSIAIAKISSDVATGLYDINAYRADMTARTKALTAIVTRYKTEIGAGVTADLTVKIAAATKLTVIAETQAETEARATLDKASELVGEVESKLSTLGQVEIDGDTGMITDIDFSIDPMIIDRGDGSGDVIPTDPRAAQSGGDGSVQIDAALDSGMIDGAASTDASVGSGVNVGL